MKSGPADLAAYHADQLELGRKAMQTADEVGLDRGTGNYQRILAAGITEEQTTAAPKKRRSDAGVKRPPKTEPKQEGALNSLEVSKLESAIEMLIQTEHKLAELTRQRDFLRTELQGYLGKLKG